MSWLPLKIPENCKIVVSCTYEEGNPDLMQVREATQFIFIGRAIQRRGRGVEESAI